MPRRSDLHANARLLFALGALVFALTFARAASASPTSTSAPSGTDSPEPRVFTAPDGATLPYLLLKPAHYDPARQYPLVLFYHGAGERGDDNHAQWQNGIAAFATPENREKYPCFIVAPQCPKQKQWVDVPWSDHPHVFAAAVPVCGGGDEHTASKIKDIPLWAFHGGADPVVKTIRTRHMIAALKAAGGHPKYTEYPGVGHNSWDAAFNDPALIAWLFSQHSNPLTPPLTRQRR